MFPLFRTVGVRVRSPGAFRYCSFVSRVFARAASLTIRALNGSSAGAIFPYFYGLTKAYSHVGSQRSTTRAASGFFYRQFVRNRLVFLFVMIPHLRSAIRRVSFVNGRGRSFKVFVRPSCKVSPRQVVRVFYCYRLVPLLSNTTSGPF